jgi:DNA (cytosine-5)-methyltransferase 1
MVMKVNALKTNKIIGIDLFSGCGGLTEGLKVAGVEVKAAVEIDSLASIAYQANHPEVTLIQQDIRQISAAYLLDILNIQVGELDILAGCPPCQGFSTLRTRNSGKAVEDDRNDLILEFLRLVQELKPKTVMLENVPGLSTDQRFQTFQSSLSALGYFSDNAVLDVSSYGVPQRRRRFIFIASLHNKPVLAKSNANQKITVKDVIGRLPVPGSSGDQLHDLPKTHSDKVKSIIKAIPKNGGSRSSLPTHLSLDCHKNFKGFNDVYGRMRWEGQSPTITSGCNNPSKGRFLHPDQDRVITLREASMLQGFPKDYKFPNVNNKTALALMIGNALPPPFVTAHTKELIRTIRN